jgi:hypothetical protein
VLAGLLRKRQLFYQEVGLTPCLSPKRQVVVHWVQFGFRCPRSISLGLSEGKNAKSPALQLFRLVLAMTLVINCSIRLPLQDGHATDPLS